MDFSRDVLYRSFGCKSNHILCSGPMCRPPQYQDGRARRSPTTNRSKLAINSFSSSHITSQILTQINGRRHKQFTLFIFWVFFSNWSSQVGAPLAPPTSCLKVRHMFDLQHQVPTKLGGGIKNGSIMFKPPFSAIRLGE